MYLIQITVGQSATPEIADALYAYVDALKKNGQVEDFDNVMALDDEGFLSVYVNCHQPHALDDKYRNTQVQQAEEHLLFITQGSQLTYQSLGFNPEVAPACACETPSALQLYTAFREQSSPLRCLDCGLPVPLFFFSEMTLNTEIRERLHAWQRQYNAVEQLYADGDIARDWATAQLSDPNSALTQLGEQLAEELSVLLGKKVFSGS